MQAITQPTHNQSPIQIEDETAAYNAKGEIYEYQSKPDVVITGFGPFHSIVINLSFQIAQTLPSSLKSGDGSNIHVTSHPEAIHVAWESVLQVIPELYNRHAGPSVDSSTTQGDTSSAPFFIHIGVGYPGLYHIETVAHRDGYWRKDVDDKEAPERQKCRGRGYPCEGDKDPLSPGELKTAIDVEGVLKDVRNEVKDLVSTCTQQLHVNEEADSTMILDTAIERSEDAGNYMCDFIFYTSLREARLRYGNAGLNKVLFVHVPPEGNLEEGVKVLSAVIRSIVKRGKTQSSSA